MRKDKTHFDSNELINDALIIAPAFSLSDNFAEKLAEKVEHKFAWENYFKEFLIYLGVFAGIAIISAAMAIIWYDANWKEWLNFFTSNIWLIAGINFLIVFILFTDRVLLRYFLYKKSPNSLI